MKKVGLIGGMTYHSTLMYENGINSIINQRLGGYTSAELLTRYLNFADIESLMQAERWDTIGQIIISAARELVGAGSACVAIATSTAHKIAPELEGCLKDSPYHIPLLHIGDAIAEQCLSRGLKSVGLLGTRHAMVEYFIRQRIEQYGVKVLVPTQGVILDELHDIILNELCNNQVVSTSKHYIIKVMTDLMGAGADGIVLGSAELRLLFPSRCDCLILEDYGQIPLIDAAEAHINALADFVLS